MYTVYINRISMYVYKELSSLHQTERNSQTCVITGTAFLPRRSSNTDIEHTSMREIGNPLVSSQRLKLYQFFLKAIQQEGNYDKKHVTELNSCHKLKFTNTDISNSD